MVPLQKTINRFWTKVKKTNSCWLYQAYVNPFGYGDFWYDGKSGLAHRFAYEILKGKIPKSLVIDHLCKIRNCVNPDHMELVSLAENSFRGTTAQNNMKKICCVRGHPFSKENTYMYKSKERVCRKCKALLTRNRRKTKKYGN